MWHVDGVEAVDLTGDERKEQNLSAETEQNKHESVNGDDELGTQEHNLKVHARLMEVYMYKVTDEGNDRMEVTEQISDAHVTVSPTTSKDATQDDAIITSIRN